MCSSIKNLFQGIKLEQIARETGFLKRKSKITPAIFVDLMFRWTSQRCSLDKLAFESEITHSVSIKKQALDERFSEASISFSKNLLAQAISAQTKTPSTKKNKELFNRVLIKDSTRFDIDESLKEHFPGCGGSASQASISIQFEYDLKHGDVSDIELQAATDRDSTDALEKKETIQEKDLIIRDLGYYHGKVIKHISDNKAYYISRLHHSCNVYMHKEGEEKIDFGKLYYQMTINSLTSKDITVYLGKERIPSRLIIALMPQEIYEKRIRERQKQINHQPKSKSRSKDPKKREAWDASQKGKTGYQMSDEFKSRAHFNLFICNIESQDLTADEIMSFYRIRWQIELFFKVWKSIVQIHKIPKMKYDRFITSIYMSLLWIVLQWKIVFPCQRFIYQKQNRLISIFKCMSTLKERCREVRALLQMSRTKMGKQLRRFCLTLFFNHELEIKKNKVSYEELYPLLFCKSNNYDYICNTSIANN
jgi:hypothetical protein